MEISCAPNQKINGWYYPREEIPFATYELLGIGVECIQIGNKEILLKDIESSKYSVHEILTLASIIEKEGKLDDFVKISTVFHNRLNKGQRLESCATTYYGMGLDFNATGIANSEMIANINPYNTYKIDNLPIAAISSPSEKAILAALNPEDSQILYFLSDKLLITCHFKSTILSNFGFPIYSRAL